jgi:Bax protein
MGRQAGRAVARKYLPRSRLARAALGIAAILIPLCLGYFLSDRGESLPDMSVHPAGTERKAAFFEFLAPIVEARNDAIRSQREKLLRLAQKFAADGHLSILDEIWLKRLAEDFAVDWHVDDIGAVIAELRHRVDIVPRPLVLVQAAKESGWGTSRFAREANNLFGQWCYRKGCGLVPARRAADASHEVRRFESVEDAVDAYLHNINTGNSYARLRQIRLALRERGKRPVAADLAEGLLFYSQRRGQYVEEVQSMLRQYHEFRRRMEMS